jgi:hypothetical protein
MSVILRLRMVGEAKSAKNRLAEPGGKGYWLGVTVA